MLDRKLTGILLMTAAVACGAPIEQATEQEPLAETAAPMPESMPSDSALPPDEEGAPARLETSPRHGEWVDVTLPGAEHPIATWVVYPERPDSAPVVIVIQEIYGMTDWIRGVADQLAADGFIAVAPDLLSGKGPDGGGTDSLSGRDEAVSLVRELTPEESVARLDAVRAYSLEIPAGNGEVAAIGFCWGGGTSFRYAAAQPDLSAAVVYYGVSLDEPASFEGITAPVLGLYGGDDERVNATIPSATDAMTALGKSYEPIIYDGAGHGFLRAQNDRDGANMRASEQAWPRMIEFLRQHTS